MKEAKQILKEKYRKDKYEKEKIADSNRLWGCRRKRRGDPTSLFPRMQGSLLTLIFYRGTGM